MSLSRAFLASALAAALFNGTPTAMAVTKQPRDPQVGRPLSGDEIYWLYSNRSWMWNEGAGFFAAKKRLFTAWTQEGGSSSYGIGRWFITKPGKLCFRAQWHTAYGSIPKLTCFSHRQEDGVIYQRREPDGEWYIFKSATPKKTDEYAKLRSRDYTLTRMNQIKRRLETR